ncbi:MAG: ribbon-helix-helix domain-containing protein [Prevotella sp.]|nr:ribbon-helix-helix domain-containing protein [Prevotella sp.]
MDKKYIERPKTFDKKEYDREYHKKHYKQITFSMTSELKERLDSYCKKAEISRTEFLRRALDVLENM